MIAVLLTVIAMAIGIERAKVELGACVTLGCRLFKPTEGLMWRLRDKACSNNTLGPGFARIGLLISYQMSIQIPHVAKDAAILPKYIESGTRTRYAAISAEYLPTTVLKRERIIN